MTIPVVEKISKQTGVDQKQVKSVIFWFINHICDEDRILTDEAIYEGAEFNHGHNGVVRMVKSYKALLYAEYEEICERGL